MYAYPYGMNNNMQQQLAQNRMGQLQQQYNNMFPMMQQQQTQQPQQFLKGRPVTDSKLPAVTAGTERYPGCNIKTNTDSGLPDLFTI